MSHQRNEFGQPVGLAVPDWQGCPLPAKAPLHGKFCRLEPIETHRHGDDLFAAYQQASDGRDWTYLAVGPFTDRPAFDDYLQQLQASNDPVHYAVIDRQSDKPLGTIALMRIDSKNGTIEVGFVVYSPALKQSRIATEAHYLLMQYVFETLGYRRYEWKCDALNEPSKTAAQRLGFRFEGVFRCHLIYKGRERDTAWFSIIHSEWPRLKQAFITWLDDRNFDRHGQQNVSLSQLTNLESIC